MERKFDEGVLFSQILVITGWKHIEKQGTYWWGPRKTYYDLRKRTTIYEVGDGVLKNNNTCVLGSSKKLNRVWKGIWVVYKMMPAVLLKIRNKKKVCVVHKEMWE